jgi:hypothetical protein
MRTSIRIVILLAASAGGASSTLAQASDRPGLESTQLSSKESVVRLLQSKDAREQAWGAWYAGRDVMPQLIPLLQRVALQHANGLFVDSAAVTDAAIDSLIQLRAKVPEGLMRAIYGHRSAAALILASHDVEAATPFLLDLAATAEAEQWFAAANLLLRGNTKRFAPTLMNSLTVTAVITISDDGKRASGSEGGSCFTISCDFGATGVPGFPPWATYELTGLAFPGAVVLATGPKPMYYRRHVSPSGMPPSRGSSTGGGPSSEERFTYVSALLGIDSNQLPVQGVEVHSVAWRGMSRTDDAIEQIRANIVQRYAELVRLLVQRELLQDHEAAALRRPAIKIEIHDARSDQSTPFRR